MIRVFVADDHAIVRRGLADLFAETPDIVLVGEAIDGRAALQALEPEDIDVFLLDLSLPKINGTEVLRRAHAARPKLPIVILSMYPEDQYADRLRAEGAAAYLNKGQSVQDVLAAIRAVALGKCPAPSARRPENPPPDPARTAPPQAYAPQPGRASKPLHWRGRILMFFWPPLKPLLG